MPTATDGTGPTTEVHDKPPEGEVGSAAGAYDRLYLRYEDGKVFSTDPAAVEDFETMLRLDGKARTLEQVLTLPLRSTEGTIEPAPGDTGQAEQIREDLTRPANAGGMTTPLELVIAQMTSAVVNRRAYFEKVFGTIGDRVVYRKIRQSPASSCRILYDKRNYSFAGYKQRFRRGDDVVEETIKPEKAFVYIHGQHRDPLYGVSDLETAWSVFESKQKIRFLWYSFLENQVIPKGIAKSGKPGQERTLAEKVASLKGGGVVGIGPDDDVSAFESNGQGAAVFLDAMRYLDTEMSGSVLAGFTNLTDGSTGTGSFALSKDASDLFLRFQQAKLTEMASALTAWVLADLTRWNYGRGAPSPVFKFAPLARESVNEALEMLKHLSTQRFLNPAIPEEFLELLVEKVADLLGVDRSKVADAIARRGEATPTQQIQAGADAATELLRRAGVGDRAAAAA